jgi:hypothetical protein
LNIERSQARELSGAVRDTTRVVLDHVSSANRLAGARKEKPGGGNAGLDIFVIGVYGFKYAAWLSFMPPESGEAICFSCSANSFFFFFSFLVLRLRF